MDPYNFVRHVKNASTNETGGRLPGVEPSISRSADYSAGIAMPALCMVVGLVLLGLAAYSWATSGGGL
jgi:hypothetical protein